MNCSSKIDEYLEILQVPNIKRLPMKVSQPRLKFSLSAENADPWFRMDTHVEFIFYTKDTSLTFAIDANSTSTHPASNLQMITFTVLKPTRISMNRVYPEINLSEQIDIFFEEDFLVFKNVLFHEKGETVLYYYHNKLQL